MKTLITFAVVAISALASILILFMASVIGIVAVSTSLELWDFAWDTTFHVFINEQAIMDNIMKYWVRFISIIYIPVVIFVRVNDIKNTKKV